MEGTGMVLHESISLDMAIAAPCKVSIELHPPNRRKFDIDNRIKAILDVLEGHAVIENDEQIHDLRVKKREKIPGGRAVVELRW